MALNINCNGYLEIDFASYLIVDNTVKFRPDIEQYILRGKFDKIPTAISVNTENLNLFVNQEDYCPPGGIDITSPCDSSVNINVNCVSLNKLIVEGMIGHIVGVDVLDTSSDVAINPPGLNLRYVSTNSESTFIDNEVLDLIDDINAPIPGFTVTVDDFKVQNVSVNDSAQYCFLIAGIFRIKPIY